MIYNKWLDKKPEITEECILITVNYYGDTWHYDIFVITHCEGGGDSIKCRLIATDMNRYYCDICNEIEARQYFLIKHLNIGAIK